MDPPTAIHPETKMEFITQADKDKIEEDLRGLHIKGKEIIERIAEARALGDLKENAEERAADFIASQTVKKPVVGLNF